MKRKWTLLPLLALAACAVPRLPTGPTLPTLPTVPTVPTLPTVPAPLTLPPVPPSPAASAPAYAAWYRQAASAGRPVLAIDPALSLLAVTVHRAGALARLGHDHVVASRTLEGFAAPLDGRADFSFRLDQLSVDEPALRRAAGLAAGPSAEAVAGTRVNMLTRVLDAEHYPLVLLHAERADADTLRLDVTLHGVTRRYTVPTRIGTVGAKLEASGTLQLLQSDFGITPLSLLGGAIAVQDRLDVRFVIVARPLR